MNRRLLVRRYLPLAAVVVVQLLIVAVVPSRAPDTVAASAVGGDPTAPADYVDPSASATEATGDGSGGSGGSTSGGAGSTSGGSGGGGGGGGGTSGAAGDTSHCVGGKQFDAGQFSFAPACVAKYTGEAKATSPGVTDKEIVVVRYDSQSDPAVDALLDSVDLGSSDPQEDQFREAAQKFINEKYELYGRKIKIVDYKGTCDLLPPQYDCLREDMRTIVTSLKPFFVMWRTTLASPAFDELTNLKVLNAGGQHFPDSFNNSRRPYHYDQMMTGSNVAKFFAKYWCNRLAPYPVKYGAGLHPTKTGQPMNGSERVLGIITPDDPQNTAVLEELKGLVANCGGGVKATYQYAQDIDRAQEQRKAGIARMREAGVTFLSCVCDAIAPYFMIITEDEDQYWPENFLAGTGYMDHDYVGRLYDVSTTWSRSFGISTLPVQESLGTNNAADVWKAAGNSGNPPYNAAEADWGYYQFIAEAIHMAGPNLTPETFEQGAFRSGHASTRATEATVSFGPGNYGYIDDVKEVYFSKTATSPVDGRPRAYVPMNNGKRYSLDAVPNTEFTRP